MKGNNITKIKVHLCKECINDLKKYNPYIGPVEIIKVSKTSCDNYTDEDGNFINI